jgi:outer membrane protein OmpA-like peptidoglycan-associated protein
MRRPARLLAMSLGATALTACASGNLVVVLPESNGHVGAVEVRAGDNTTLLNQAYAANRPGDSARQPTVLNPGKVNRIFGAALAAMPQPPVSFTLYFPEGATSLDPPSLATLGQVFAEVRRRKAAEIVIVGHTDTVGDDAANDELSRRRAEAMKRELAPILAAQGIAIDSVTTAGRGKRELAEPEPDQTSDPRNRRVVITVR